jgi:hypothetical protein
LSLPPGFASRNDPGDDPAYRIDRSSPAR